MRRLSSEWNKDYHQALQNLRDERKKRTQQQQIHKQQQDEYLDARSNDASNREIEYKQLQESAQQSHEQLIATIIDGANYLSNVADSLGSYLNSSERAALLDSTDKKLEQVRSLLKKYEE